MKDINLNSTYNKIQYPISWIMFILSLNIIVWIIAYGLSIYGKDTSDNKEKKKGILNLSYQRFIYWYGLIMTYIVIISLILAMLGLI